MNSFDEADKLTKDSSTTDIRKVAQLSGGLWALESRGFKNVWRYALSDELFAML